MQAIIATLHLWYIIPWHLRQRRITIWLLWLEYWYVFLDIYLKNSGGQDLYNFFYTLSWQMKTELLLVTSPVINFLHFAFSRYLKDAFPKCSLLCVDPVLSMLCSQNSGENCSTRFWAGEASPTSPLL